jgi:phthiocerol/phenolphthiocerol synthesis type-I polyketide synthase E
VYRAAGVLHLDWWYDSRRIDPARAASLADAFSTTVMELTREAVAESEIDLASDELSLVDLSSTEA